MAPDGQVMAFSPAEHAHLIPYLAAIHAACITHDRAIVTFLPPLSHEKLLAWWKDSIAEVKGGTRVILIMVHDPEGLGARLIPKGPDVMGVVMLAMPFSETGRIRAFVEKLLVQRGYRRRGVARALMHRVEAEATARGKLVLMVDTETGSTAEGLYRGMGYVEIGKAPVYALSPGGAVKGETFFYKQLAS